MNTVHKENENCCGCTSCVNICPQKAIKMSQDNKGFFYPQIDVSKCIHCGLCKNVCNFMHFSKDNSFQEKSYAIRHKNYNELITSRSGGFFSALAHYMISRGGICYGAVIDENLEIVHKKAETLDECFAFKGSKYVQSRIPDSLFSDIKGELDSGHYVLFSGTGCQVHGLLAYLDKTKTNRSNLITVDFICHGVPSPEVWEEYKNEVEFRHGCNLKNVNFRDKSQFGWATHIETYTFVDNKKESNSNWADVYYLHCMFRDSCYKCPYTTIYRKSDFTIGDYWGFEKVIDKFNDNLGLSLVITHNDNADKLLNQMSDLLCITSTELTKSLQPQLLKPAYRGPEYKRFWKKWSVNKKNTVRFFFFPGFSRKIYLGLFRSAKKFAKYMLTVLQHST